MLDAPELANSPRFATNPDRVKHREELIEQVENRFRLRTRHEWLTRCKAAGIPAAPIATIDEALLSPQAAARGIVRTYEHPTVGELRTVMTPIQMSNAQISEPSPPPTHGQHTDQVLAALGYTSQDVSRMRADGTVQ